VRKMAESVQTAINVELEALVNSQAEKIDELETTYAYLKHQKESITAGYRSLKKKHNTFTEPSGRRRSSPKPTRRSLLEFEGPGFGDSQLHRLLLKCAPSASRAS
jgi:hypothetical protein